MGKGKEGGKKRKKENLKKILILAIPNSKTLLVQHNLTLFKPYKYSFITVWGRKS